MKARKLDELSRLRNDVLEEENYYYRTKCTKLFYIVWIFQIKREIGTLKLLRHPNVVRLHEVYFFMLFLLVLNNCIPKISPES